MSIKRFFGKTTSEALRKVRDALGSDGVILSNRAADGGVEILALSNNDMTAMIPPPESEKAESAPQVHREQEADEFWCHKQALLPSARKNALKYALEADTDFKNLARPDTGLSNEKQAQWAGAAVIENDRVTPIPAAETPQMTAPVAQPIPDPAIGRKTNHSTIDSGQPARVTNEAAVPEVSVSGSAKRGRNTRKAPGKIIPDENTSSKKNPPVIDPLQMADAVAASVLKEIRSLRGTMEQQFSALNWNNQEKRDPVHGGLLRQVLAAGFSRSLAHSLLEQLPAENTGKGEKDTMNWIKNVLTSNLRSIGDEREILEKGGVYALVGPTGVGKTTTTAKLAARCVVRHGADKLALLTTDSYRIGGHEQLRIYGKILGVTVLAVRDAQDLSLALAELRGKHMVLIDTVGMGQRDQMVAEQVAMLAGCGTPVKRLLLLNAASNRHTLDEVAHAYQGDGLAGAIITKLDEAVTIGCALDTAIRHRLPLYYVAGGQRVPEDLEMADSRALVNRALDNLPDESSCAMSEDAFPSIVMDHNIGAGNPDKSEARLG
ncbi:flagellar biosynthesis protein FlhF [Nitrosospira sp. NRS527]|uniref:flagellar biosynthesis protein FlhF n=1 Tax=Nitrosospira sp. NRS527 TaxID=155925 RepID=UPI001AF90DD7|nr:flagellar biosynthesis protein FlhF [Nitrosospira sp. NRS527]BCT67887.1 Signal recognition particle receptor FtsY [Nitrosospira sp. NRS527]